MALSILQRPSSVSFAGNPIIVKASTSLQDKTFLRIIAEVTVDSYTESYNYNVTGDGSATFNVAETLRAVFQSRCTCSVAGASVSQRTMALGYSIALKEVYLDKMVEVTSDTLTITGLTAVMGGLSDFERAMHSSWDADSFLGAGAVMSRKPSGEMVYGGREIYIPVAANTGETISMSVVKLPGQEATSAGSSVAVSAYAPGILKVPTSSLADGMYRFSLSPSARSYSVDKYVRHVPDKRCVSFLFLNGFGILESITALTGRAKSFGVTQEFYAEGGRIGQSYTDIVNLGGAAGQKLTVSTGLITREWADWYASEFFTARKVWMLFAGTHYMPVAIEVDDDMKLYDDARPSLCELTFTVRCAFNGSTTSTVR